MSTEPLSHLETEQLRRRNRELAILNSIAEALNHQVDLTRALQTVLDQVGALFDLTTGWVWLIHDKTGESYLAGYGLVRSAMTVGSQVVFGNFLGWDQPIMPLRGNPNAIIALFEFE